MSYTIAVAGKGGTGKTTIAGIIVGYLIKEKQPPVLAIDADPNSNFADCLGVKSNTSLVEIIDNIKDNPAVIPSGMTKDRFIQMKVEESIVETEKFDLLTMGRPEGPGCYCYANNVLREMIDKLSYNYKYIVLDNEAGMEHLSRRIAMDITSLVIISDFSVVGLRSAKRIYDLSKQLKIKIGKTYLVLNKITRDYNVLEKQIKDTRIELAGVIPENDIFLKWSIGETPLIDWIEKKEFNHSLKEICEKIIK